MELFQDLLAVDGVDPLAHGVGHLTEPGVEDVENRLASVLDDAFFKAFDDAFLDAFLDAYEAFNAARPQGQWKPFLDWVAEDYDRPAVKDAFARKLGNGLQLDVLLRRE